MAECIDFRVLFQCASMIVALIALCIFIAARVKYGRSSSNTVGAIALLLHIVVFYTAVCVREYAGVDILLYISEAVRVEFVYGDWSAAIRLQMVISLLLMALTVVRRERWIKLAGLK